MDDLLRVDPEALLSFAQQLEGRANDLEAGLAAERAKVEDAARRSGSLYTRDGRTAPVFKPMGKALGKVFVAAHQEAEARAVRVWEDGEIQVKPRG
ncbi:Uncharacterised protein [Mycobacteroides abscessus subsp. abscessus]|uniref:hypothetical protein n=1 Tax=Mycobacteroides abscessus TaxID=36809 RepID=UPI0009A815DB|nr:hypothetical protein [Mycobacteroides abscessus]SLJ82207.1 Uncharacterised protein [Mycobacteroides abscessus subsp. abscessus]